MTMKILIVEDEPKLAEVLRDYLTVAGHEVTHIAHGDHVVPYVRANPCDIVLLDVMLPGRDGLEICRELRMFTQVPILFLTARVEEIDRIVGLELGADDYLCKPYSPREVVARVAAIRRRLIVAASAASAATPIPSEAERLVPAPGLVLDRARFAAQLDQHDLAVTPVEFRLLWTLAAAPGRVFNRKQLMERVYDDARVVTDRTMDSHVKNLRKKLSEARPDADIIEAVYGVGYKLRDPQDGA